jgi:hypothetical protein
MMESNLLHVLVATPLFRPHEYLDPGSGSFLIQLLIGGLVAVGFGIRMFWGRIKAFFTRKSTAADATTDLPADTPDNNDAKQ